MRHLVLLLQCTTAGGPKPDIPVGAVQKRKRPPKFTKPRPGKSSPPATCTRCRKSPSHERQSCPARDAICHKCAKRGHFQAVCRSTAKVREVNQGDPFIPFLGGVDSQNAANNPWRLSLLLNDTPTEFNIDTGAEASVISKARHEKIGSPPLLQPSRTLRGPSNYPLPVAGCFTGKLKHGSQEVQQEIFVVRNLRRQLLGRPAIDALGLVVRVGAIFDDNTSAVQLFPQLFNGLGKLEGEYEIKLRPDFKPYAISVPRRVAVPFLNKVRTELERMERLGVIAKVEVPTDWCAGMVVVPKTNGTVCICVDLTKLNQRVCHERHPLPAVERVLAQLAEAHVFSKLHANSGFWQIPLSANSAPLTTFLTPFGCYCFHRLPFGITSAPEIFQRQMSAILDRMEGVVCMMDDILGYSRDQAEHDDRLLRVLQWLKAAGLTLNKDKCEFSQKEVKFLGQMVDRTGVRPDPSKVKAI